MKREGKIKSLVVMSMIVGILLLSLASAGWMDWLRETITGRASFQETNVTITLVGVNMVSIIVQNATMVDTDVDPTEEGTVNITFNVTVIDADGAGDINASSVIAEFLRADEGTRQNNTGCTENTGQSTSTSKNFTCTVTLWYFDAPGAWGVNVTANDLGNTTYNSTNYLYNFSYDQLQAIKINPDGVYWTSISIGAENQTANNNTVINNTGNYNATGNVELNATNLYSGANFLDVGNISIGIDTGSECNGTTMVNAENTGISGVILERGNLTLGVSNETIYYCLQQVPSIPTGTYDTTTEGAWTIRLA